MNAQGQAVDQRIGNDTPGVGQDAAEGMPRNVHPFGGLGLAQALQIREAERLQPLHGQVDLGQFAQGDSAGLEVGHPGRTADQPAFSRAGHTGAPLTIICAQLLRQSAA
jgi:hypothetical protein